MDKKTKITIGILLAVVILVGGWWGYSLFNQSKCSEYSAYMKEKLDKVNAKTPCNDDNDCEFTIYYPCQPYCIHKNVSSVTTELERKLPSGCPIPQCVDPRENLKCSCQNSLCTLREKKQAKQVTITTDKAEYKQGEIVKIIVKNNLDKSIFLANCKPIIIEKRGKLQWKELIKEACEQIFIQIDNPIKTGVTKTLKEFNTGAELQGEKFFPISSYRLKLTYFKGCTNKNIDSCSKSETIYSNQFRIK